MLVVVERRLQNARREVDVVHLRIVVGVDRRWRHVPFQAVHRLADLVQLARELELVGAKTFPQRIVAADLDARIIAPLFGIPNLVRDGFQFLQSLLSWSRASSRRVAARSWPRAFSSASTIFNVRALPSAPKVRSTNFCPSASPNSLSV